MKTKDLVIISACPNDLYFNWQLRTQCHNFRKYGYSDKYHVLILYHDNRAGNQDFKEEWEKLAADYPEVKFYFYRDARGELFNLIRSYGYIPLLRPWLLKEHFTKYPELSEKAVLYLDSDVVFTKKPDFSKFLDDDICYLSDTRSYIAASYFDSKVKDVKEGFLTAYNKIDVLGELTGSFGISRKIAEDNELNSGGAQYILKNITAAFWSKVLYGCISIRVYLSMVNNQYFESEDKGFQAWCADMFSVLWNLWAEGKETRCPEEMNFAWATDDIKKWDDVYIYHDAGASTRPIREGHQLFHKRDLPYVNNERTPYEDDLSFVSKEYCSFNYVKEIDESK